MPANPSSDQDSDLLATLQHALETTQHLACELATDPLVGSEARGLLGRLDCIRAEVEVIATLRQRPRTPDNDENWRNPSAFWQ